MGAPILLFRTCLAKMASSSVLGSPLQVCLGCGKSSTAGLNIGVWRTSGSVYSRWGGQFRSVVSYGRVGQQQQAGQSVGCETQSFSETLKTQRRSKSSKARNAGSNFDFPFLKASGSFATEAIEENLQSDILEVDGNDGDFQLGGMANDVDSVDEEMEEVMVAMTSSLNSNFTVASTSVFVGIDPDLSGAIAVLKSLDNRTTAQVIDVPCVTVAVNKKMRRRHDYQSIAAIVDQLQAPRGSIAYVEQAMPFPKDGKQGWYITGYGYGVWLGILAAAGFTVVPVQARAWKTAMGICGKEFTKDDSRALASSMFPVLSAQLRRKKDHGRAEALLIAAFGKGMTVTKVASLDEPCPPHRREAPSQPTSLTAILSSCDPPF